MTTNEKILLNYNHETNYTITPTNQVGTDADFLSLYPSDTPLRTVPTPTGDIAYVRKFGVAFSETDITAIAAPSANLTVKVYALDGTLIGSRANGGAFVSESTASTAQGIYVTFTASGAATIDTSLSATFPTAGVVSLKFSAETLVNLDVFTFYVSSNGSSYYDSSMKYGGARHTPALNDASLSYFDIATAYGTLAASNNDGVEILDSETYDEDLTTDNQALDSADTIIYAAASQSPTITRGIGARVTREQTAVFTNINAIFWNENGSDANDGTWQDPKLTITAADSALAAQTYVVYGGSGGTVTGGTTETYTSTAGHVDVEYGYTPTLTGIFNLSGNNVVGLTVEGIIQKTGAHAGTISECTIKNSTTYGIYIVASQLNFTGTISKNLIYNNGSSGIRIRTNRTGIVGGTISNNIVHSNGANGIYLLELLYSLGASTISTTINNNICYDNTDAGINIAGLLSGGTTTVTATLSNNTLFNNNYGIQGTGTNNYAAASCINNITNSNTTYDLSATSLPVSYTAYETQELVTLGAGNITTDPKFCKNTLSYKLGISSDSPCYRTGSTNDDIGVLLRIVEIDAADIIINGVKIDGQNQINNNIFIRDTANHTGAIIKWSNIFDAQGIAIDLYDDGTDTDAFINNNIIENNGNGLKLSYGGNESNQNIIHGNTIYGIYSNYTVNSFNHNAFYNNQYGIYLAGNSSSIIIKDSIFNLNSIYGIYSNTSITITYCCITDATTANVDTTATTNVTNNPLFISTTSESENFNIKSIKGGYSYDSACIDAASDGDDIGAYLITRTISSDYWQKYQFTYNPRNVEYNIASKSNKTFTNAHGTTWNWSKARRRGFALNWKTGQYSNETDRLKAEYFNSIYQRDDSQVNDDKVIVRFNPLPSQQIDSGTAATVSATGKTITDTAKSLVEDEFRGYHVGVKYDNDASAGSELFYAGMETDLSEWTSQETDGTGVLTRATPGLDSTTGCLNSNLSAAADRAYGSKSGLTISENYFMYSYYLNINSLTMTSGDTFFVQSVTSSYFVNILTRTGASYYISARLKDDASGNNTTSLIQVIAKRPASAVSTDGELYLYVNGVLGASLTGKDNYDVFQSASSIFLGAFTGIDAGTTGDLKTDELYFIEGDSMLIDATHKTAMVASVAWTVDEWIGYALPLNGYYYYITDNDANQLTLSDPDGTLVSGTQTTWSIEKYFKITKNTGTVLTVDDDDSELVAGSYDWVIRFIECHILSPNMKYSQPRYYFQKEEWKTGYNIMLEEI